MAYEYVKDSYKTGYNGVTYDKENVNKLPTPLLKRLEKINIVKLKESNGDKGKTTSKES